jgi:hypothetical protein
VKKGVSETFDEHEQDTARRAYTKELVEGASRTAQMPKLDLDALRAGSGTRPAVGPDAIERHMRERMDRELGPPPQNENAVGPSSEGNGSIDIEPDPHSRPTIEACAFATALSSGAIPLSSPPPRVSGVIPSAPNAIASPYATSTPSAIAFAPVTPEPVARLTPVAKWAVAAAIVGVVFLVSAASTVGFFLGRRSAR